MGKPGRGGGIVLLFSRRKEGKGMQRKEQTREQERRKELLSKLKQLSENYDRLLKAYDEILHETWSESIEVGSKKECRSSEIQDRAK